MKTEVSKKAQSILTHPFVIGAFLAYVINNHILQIYFPSWLTGKLSDFAWLFFVPYAILFLATSLFPKKLDEKSQFQTAVFLLVGIAFTLIKTNIAVNQTFVGTFEKLFKLPIQIILDPSDLLALFSLAGSFYFWKGYRPKEQKLSFSKSFFFLGILLIFTLADAPRPDYGITSLRISQDSIVATSTYAKYFSDDGGLSWEEHPTGNSLPENEHRIPTPTFITSEDGSLQVRIKENRKIEISTDNGKTWMLEYDLKPENEAQRAYYEITHAYNFGIQDMIIDPVSENIIFAMGNEGILMRTKTDEWKWISVGNYTVPDYTDIVLKTLLAGEFFLALAVGLLIFSSIGHALYSEMKNEDIWLLLIILNWIILGFMFFIDGPKQPDGTYTGAIITIILQAMLVLPVIIAIHYLVRAIQTSTFRKTFLYLPLGTIIYIAPYYLWAKNIVKTYSVATIIAITSIAIIISVGIARISLEKTGANEEET